MRGARVRALRRLVAESGARLSKREWRCLKRAYVQAPRTFDVVEQLRHIQARKKQRGQ